MNEVIPQLDVSTKDSMASTATRMDAECLDQALFRLIEHALLSLCRDVPPSVNFYVKHLALPFIQFVSILATNGQTPATKLLKLELSSATKDDTCFSKRVAMFALLSAALPAIHDPVMEWLQSTLQHGGHQAEVSELARIAQKRQRMVLTIIQKAVTRLFPVTRLCCLLAFWAGITRTPNLAMLFSGLVFQPKGQEKPRLHVDYAHRRWLQHEATSTAKIFLAGLWMIPTWKPIIDTFLLKPLAIMTSRARGVQPVAPTICAICKSDMNFPILLSCRHRMCYTCFYADLDPEHSVSCRTCRKFTHESQAMFFAPS